MKEYKDFEDVSEQVRAATPEVIYKLRDWNIEHHKQILTNQVAWFAHPHNLNDPFDVRPPYKFIADHIDWNVARELIREAGRLKEPTLSDEDLETQVEIRLEKARQDPESYFKKNRGTLIMDRAFYDRIGVFSCSLSCTNEAMWAYYGANHEGFAVGFNTVELARALDCSIAFVDYNDSPIDYHVFGKNDGFFEKELLRKSTKWSHEEELRFITLGIGSYKNRAVKFSTMAISEIVFGINTPAKNQEDIIAIAQKLFPTTRYYKVQRDQDSYSFKKVEL